jgi:FkbM family methyltransferase
LEEKLQGEKRLKVTLLTNKAACPTGNITLLYDPDCANCSGSADATHKDYANRLHAVKKKEVPCIPINELLTRYAVEDTVVMKVDVECMEMSLLKAILTAGTLPLIDDYAITWHEYCIDSLQVSTLQWILADSPSKLLKWR